MLVSTSWRYKGVDGAGCGFWSCWIGMLVNIHDAKCCSWRGKKNKGKLVEG